MEQYDDKGLSTALKKKFCKESGIRIQLFSEPYFSERISLLGFDRQLRKFEEMIYIQFNNNEEEYFKYCDKLQEKIVNHIKNSKAYATLNTIDISSYANMWYVSLLKADDKCQIKQSDIFKPQYVGKKFISIDIQKANFSAMVNFAERVEDAEFNWTGGYNYDIFMSNFTNIDYFKESKYIRQVIFGQLNIHRIETYEKYLISRVYASLIKAVPELETHIEALCKDEIIMNADNLDDEAVAKIKEITDGADIPLKLEMFKLGRVVSESGKQKPETVAYVKKIYDDVFSAHIEIKCCNAVHMTLVARMLNHEEITDNDLVFYSEYGMAKLMEKPRLSITWNENTKGTENEEPERLQPDIEES